MPRTDWRVEETPDGIEPSRRGEPRLDAERAAELRDLADQADRGETVDLTSLTRDEVRKRLFR